LFGRFVVEKIRGFNGFLVWMKLWNFLLETFPLVILGVLHGKKELLGAFRELFGTFVKK
jgi:hypothetical protein